MPWLKVDDKLHDHRKARRAQKAAMGVWVLAGSWCMDNLSDGFVPESVLSRWGTRRDAARLVDAELWDVAEQDGESGWKFRNWTEFQPSKREVEAERTATKERVAKWRQNRKAARSEHGSASGNGARNGVGNGVTNDVRTPVVTVPRPDPTRPTKKNTSSADADGAFEEFWAAYPRKVGKQAARKVWDRKTRDTPAADIMAGLQAYLPVYAKADQQFIPHPSTWLQRGSWEDEVSPGDTVEDLPHYWRTGGDPA